MPLEWTCTNLVIQHIFQPSQFGYAVLDFCDALKKLSIWLSLAQGYQASLTFPKQPYQDPLYA